MREQNFSNHARFVPGYHFVLSLLLFSGLIASLVNLWILFNRDQYVFNAILIVVLFISATFLFIFCRRFAIKAQDRAIRAEENFRYFILSGKVIDERITIGQIIALRFASNEEYLSLAERAANESLTPVEIKKAIKNWRADNHRA